VKGRSKLGSGIKPAPVADASTQRKRRDDTWGLQYGRRRWGVPAGPRVVKRLPVPFLKKHTVAPALALALFDMGCILAAYLIAVALTPRPEPVFAARVLAHLPYLLVAAVAWQFEAIDQRLYVSRRSDALTPQLLAVTKAIVIALLLTVFVLAFLVQDGLDRSFVFVFAIAALFLIVLFRLMVRLSLWGLRLRGYNYRHILFVGANERTARLAQIILSHEQYGYHIEGFLDDDEGRSGLLERHNIPYLGKIRVLEQLLVDRVIDVVYVSLPVRSHYETIQSIAHLCEGVGVPVRLAADLFPLRIATSQITRLKDVPLVCLSAPEFRPQLDIKRIPEIAVSLLLLIVLFPVFALIAVMIKLDSRGPVFVNVPRLNPRTQRTFDVFKFRTFVTKADAPLEPDTAIAGQAASAGDHVQRTRVGRFLERYALDELPQIINVWRGQITYTEPRPPLSSALE